MKETPRVTADPNLKTIIPFKTALIARVLRSPLKSCEKTDQLCKLQEYKYSKDSTRRGGNFDSMIIDGFVYPAHVSPVDGTIRYYSSGVHHSFMIDGKMTPSIIFADGSVKYHMYGKDITDRRTLHFDLMEYTGSHKLETLVETINDLYNDSNLSPDFLASILKIVTEGF